jgi:hypothetical protein
MKPWFRWYWTVYRPSRKERHHTISSARPICDKLACRSMINDKRRRVAREPLAPWYFKRSQDMPGPMAVSAKRHHFPFPMRSKWRRELTCRWSLTAAAPT